MVYFTNFQDLGVAIHSAMHSSGRRNSSTFLSSKNTGLKAADGTGTGVLLGVGCFLFQYQ